MAKKLSLPAVNIQYPWSELILKGDKRIETRGYPIPKHYVGQDLLIIETPGMSKAGPSKAEVVGVVVFGECFKYETKYDWLIDADEHLVPQGHPIFGFSKNAEKWGWRVKSCRRLAKRQSAPTRKGIQFTKSVLVSL